MTAHPNPYIRPIVCILIVALASLVATPPAFAGGRETPTAGPLLTTGTAAVAKLAAVKETPARAAKQEGTGGDGTPFFKTKKGVAALIAMGAGVAYTFYSKRHDRVKSEIRQ